MAYISNYRVHPGIKLPKKEIFDGFYEEIWNPFWNGIAKKGKF